ncbi:MAG TPA: hypothetical protein V6C88_05910 [Chroococcidiopsis sp.]
MKNNQLIVLILVWAISTILLGAPRPTWLVEKAMEVLNFEFSSKETYALTVEVIRWVRWLYFAALAFLTFYLFRRQRSWQ